MAWQDLAWQVAAPVLAALVTVVGAARQFAGVKDHRRAGEIQQLEQAIASAAARNDPLEHAYRAQMLQRMQTIHGDRTSALPMAGLFGVLGLMFLVLFSSATNWVVQILTFVAILACFAQCVRLAGIHRYTSRTLHLETGEAYEVSMVAAREAFMDSAKDLKRLAPAEPLFSGASEAWRKASASKKRDLLAGVAVMAIATYIAFEGPAAVRNGSLEWREALTWASWFTASSIALIPVLSRTVAVFCRRLQPQWLSQAARWGGQVAWSASAVMFLPRFLEWFMEYMIDKRHVTNLDDVFGVLSIYVAVGLVVLWGIIPRAMRFVRWARARAPRRPATTNAN